MKKYNFYTAYSHAADIYGLNITTELYETYGFVAWNKIGNKDLKLYKVKLDLSKDGAFWSADLPCNLYSVEQATLEYEDFQKTSPTTIYAGYVTGPTEQLIESYKHDTNNLTYHGKLVKYDILGDKLFVNEPYSQINLFYKGIYADDEGLPFLTFKEVEAIACYCAYANMYKTSLLINNPNSFQLAQSLYQLWSKNCSQARVPEAVSVNDMNKILDAKSSWDRKIYNRSYKPINN